MKFKTLSIIAILVLGGITLGTVYAANTVTSVTPDYQIQDSSNGNVVRFDINNAGNIGIGTTTPGSKLDVNTGSDYDEVRIHGSSISQYAFLSSVYNGGTNPYTRLGCWGGTSPCNVVVDIGNVGIGTTTPGSKLDVIGNIRLTGNIVSPNDICIGNC